MTRKIKPGAKASRSGEYKIIGPRGGTTGEGRTIVRGQPLPPTPKRGQSYTLHAASGRFIIKSPAKSANTVSKWSGAFKKK